MKGKQVATAAGLVVLAYHLLAIMNDFERCKLNLSRWRVQPSSDNFLRLLLAEGVLIKDLGWLL